MRRRLLFDASWIAINFLLAASILLLGIGIAWEASVRQYLKGFADAVVPLSAPPEQKVEMILSWMKHGPVRRSTKSPELLAQRDPQDTLNYRQLLQVCGTATNAFLNLAVSSGLEVRRLLLLGPDRRSMHVLAEVHLGGRWVVVDPAFRVFFQDRQGQLLTRQQLQDPQVLQEAIQQIPGYLPEYTFDRTAHVRLERIPLVGRLLRRILDSALPGWEEAANWGLILERESLVLTLMAAFMVCLGALGRLMLSWYCESRLGIARVCLRERLLRTGAALFSNPR